MSADYDFDRPPFLRSRRMSPLTGRVAATVTKVEWQERAAMDLVL
ncbi:hypothetical protein [Ruegeria conchae]|nr:hypothetical protein [Ruegeria conchae]